MVGARSLPEGPLEARRRSLDRPLTFGVRRRYATVEGRWKVVRYTLDPLGRSGRSGVVRAASGDPMTEILTESFCERCGTRYTFEIGAPRVRG